MDKPASCAHWASRPTCRPEPPRAVRRIGKVGCCAEAPAPNTRPPSTLPNNPLEPVRSVAWPRCAQRQKTTRELPPADVLFTRNAAAECPPSIQNQLEHASEAKPLLTRSRLIHLRAALRVEIGSQAPQPAMATETSGDGPAVPSLRPTHRGPGCRVAVACPAPCRRHHPSLGGRRPPRAASESWEGRNCGRRGPGRRTRRTTRQTRSRAR